MGVGTVSVAAATAVVGYDVFKDTRFKRMADRNRIITSLRVTGSAAAGDAEIELFVGTDFYGNFLNTVTGFGNRDDDIDVEVDVPAGEELFCLIKTAPGTNPINIVVNWDEV